MDDVLILQIPIHKSDNQEHRIKPKTNSNKTKIEKNVKDCCVERHHNSLRRATENMSNK